jgi:hypothetical protein
MVEPRHQNVWSLRPQQTNASQKRHRTGQAWNHADSRDRRARTPDTLADGPNRRQRNHVLIEIVGAAGTQQPGEHGFCAPGVEPGDEVCNSKH